MRKILFLLFLLIFFTSSIAEAQELTGDTKLACEAILCLSSPMRPAECAESLAKYFGISHKEPQDTVKARRNFLELCPLVSDSEVNNAIKQDPLLATLKDALAGSSGMCDANYLNRQGKWFEDEERLKTSQCQGKQDVKDGTYSETYYIEPADPEGNAFSDRNRCIKTVKYFVINNRPSPQCIQLWQHSYTDFNIGYEENKAKPWLSKWVEK